MSFFGGQPSLMNSLQPQPLIGGRSWFSFRNIGIFLIVVFLIVIIYWIVKSQTAKPSSSDYRHNTVADANSSNSSGKEAELMLFYVDWCPHCKTAKPEWEQIKTEYENKTINGYQVIFTEVNCTNETPDVEKMMNTYKIEGYPTIKLLKDGQVIEFDAKPTKENLDKFLNAVL